MSTAVLRPQALLVWLVGSPLRRSGMTPGGQAWMLCLSPACSLTCSGLSWLVAGGLALLVGVAAVWLVASPRRATQARKGVAQTPHGARAPKGD
jgi:hypothetical protein